MTSFSGISVVTVAIAAGLAVATVTAQSGEYVTVKKAIGEKAVVTRSNGATYLLNNGIGCVALERHQGTKVLVRSPVVFAGVGSKVTFPDADQGCWIWTAKRVH